jgi:hypothetical protein
MPVEPFRGMENGYILEQFQGHVVRLSFGCHALSVRR